MGKVHIFSTWLEIVAQPTVTMICYLSTVNIIPNWGGLYTELKLDKFVTEQMSSYKGIHQDLACDKVHHI